LLRLESLTSSERGSLSRGHINKRQTSLVNYPESIEKALVDWILGCHQIGALVTGSNLRKKAKQLIGPSNQEFKASYNWMSRFLRRHNLSLRCTTTKNKKNEDQTEEIQKGFLSRIKNLIATYQIHPKYIINIDETPILGILA